MRQDAAQVWSAMYPDIAVIKLWLGHNAYQHSQGSATAVLTNAFSQLLESTRRDLNLGRLHPYFKELREHVDVALKTSESSVLEALRARGETDALKSKLSTKGTAAEGNMVQLLANPGIASRQILSLRPPCPKALHCLEMFVLDIALLLLRNAVTVAIVGSACPAGFMEAHDVIRIDAGAGGVEQVFVTVSHATRRLELDFTRIPSRPQKGQSSSTHRSSLLQLNALLFVAPLLALAAVIRRRALMKRSCMRHRRQSANRSKRIPSRHMLRLCQCKLECNLLDFRRVSPLTRHEPRFSSARGVLVAAAASHTA
ncbi:hypothetical protein JKP88DRAFT_241177 [Tribonema minus]|uniref:Uncharacterized protein n=1 Tax=Tribonema minus TaxID=303371 RepID=A0A835YWV2_9STRA|nr:hypothetical protein JKP88DRAFT_241177 [Tribonema minus]